MNLRKFTGILWKFIVIIDDFAKDFKSGLKILNLLLTPQTISAVKYTYTLQWLYTMCSHIGTSDYRDITHCNYK